MLGIDGDFDLDQTSFVIVFNLAKSLVILHDEPSVLLWIWIGKLGGLAFPVADWIFAIH